MWRFIWFACMYDLYDGGHITKIRFHSLQDLYTSFLWIQLGSKTALTNITWKKLLYCPYLGPGLKRMATYTFYTLKTSLHFLKSLCISVMRSLNFSAELWNDSQNKLASHVREPYSKSIHRPQTTTLADATYNRDKICQKKSFLNFWPIKW